VSDYRIQKTEPGELSEEDLNDGRMRAFVTEDKQIVLTISRDDVLMFDSADHARAAADVLTLAANDLDRINAH
jgi:DNA recombination-dependent growth factor C